MRQNILYIFLCFFSFLSAKAQLVPYRDSVFTGYFRKTKDWIAADATLSVPLPDGKVLWLFGDTFLDNLDAATNTIPCLFQVRNSMMVQDASDRSRFITILDNQSTGVNRTPVKLVNNDTTLFWPGHGYVRGDTVITFWTRYHNTKLTRMGIYAVKIFWPSMANASAIKSILKIPISDSELNDFEFGTSLIPDESSGFLYVYGHRKNGFVLEPCLARCPVGNVTGKWEFYDGTGWSVNPLNAKKISDEAVSPTFSAFRLNGKYYLISQENGYLTCGLGRQIFALSANNPYGPFVNKKTIWVINDKYRDSYMVTYNATSHPEFISDNELLVSYNVNGICPSECMNGFTGRMNADTYRPKFVRVPLTVLDNGYAFKPQAVIQASVTSGSIPLQVDFTGRASLGDGGISYSWNFGDGSPLSTGQNPSHTFSKLGTYHVQLTVRDSKNQTESSTLTIYAGTTSNKGVRSLVKEVRIYPNPSGALFTLDLPGFNPAIPGRLVVIDVTGHVVLTKSIISHETIFDIKNRGLYMGLVIEGETYTAVKIVRE